MVGLVLVQMYDQQLLHALAMPLAFLSMPDATTPTSKQAALQSALVTSHAWMCWSRQQAGQSTFHVHLRCFALQVKALEQAQAARKADEARQAEKARLKNEAAHKQKADTAGPAAGHKAAAGDGEAHAACRMAAGAAAAKAAAAPAPKPAAAAGADDARKRQDKHAGAAAAGGAVHRQADKQVGASCILNGCLSP